MCRSVSMLLQRLWTWLRLVRNRVLSPHPTVAPLTDALPLSRPWAPETRTQSAPVWSANLWPFPKLARPSKQVPTLLVSPLTLLPNKLPSSVQDDRIRPLGLVPILGRGALLGPARMSMHPLRQSIRPLLLMVFAKLVLGIPTVCVAPPVPRILLCRLLSPLSTVLLPGPLVTVTVALHTVTRLCTIL